MSAPGSRFAADGYAVIPSIVNDRLRSFLFEYANRMAASGRVVVGDDQVPDTPSCYRDQFMEALLESLVPTVTALADTPVFPTYSYFRVYKKGDILPKHTDRPACEISLTVSLGPEGGSSWPIWVEKDGVATSICLNPGDGLIYRGVEIPHWRDRNEGDKLAQVFLHYVDQRGPHREWIYDKRGGLRTSAAARAVVSRVSG